MTSKGIRLIVRAWFELTRPEQKAVLVVLALFVLGVAARWRHVMGVCE